MHEDERRVPSSPPSSRSPWSSSGSSSRSTASSSASTAAPRKNHFGKGAGRRKQGTFVAEGPEDLDGEDLEQELPEEEPDEPEDEDQAAEDSHDDAGGLPEDEASAEEATPEEVREAFCCRLEGKGQDGWSKEGPGMVSAKWRPWGGEQCFEAFLFAGVSEDLGGKEEEHNLFFVRAEGTLEGRCSMSQCYCWPGPLAPQAGPWRREGSELYKLYVHGWRRRRGCSIWRWSGSAVFGYMGFDASVPSLLCAGDLGPKVLP